MDGVGLLHAVSSLAQVDVGSGQALVAQRGEGTVDVADLGLSMQDLAAVLHETLYEKYMNNAVTDVSMRRRAAK